MVEETTLGKLIDDLIKAEIKIFEGYRAENEELRDELIKKINDLYN